MSWTEADEASASLEEAMQRFEEQVIKYRAGQETLGVVNMYELAAIKRGARAAQTQEVWDRHPETK